jgi:hypothetical protein
MVSNSEETNKVLSKDEFAECVENINVLNLRLRNADDRCQRLRTDLRTTKQVCDVTTTAPPPPPPPPLLLTTLLRGSPLLEHHSHVTPHRWTPELRTSSPDHQFPVSARGMHARHIGDVTSAHLHQKFSFGDGLLFPISFSYLNTNINYNYVNISME